MEIRERISGWMKVAVFSLGAALMLPASEARAEWVGGGYLEAERGCEQAGWPNGVEMFRARYTPSELGGRNTVLVLNLAVGGTMIYRVRGSLDWTQRAHRARGFAVWGDLYRGARAPRLQLVQLMSATTGGATFPRHNDVRMSVRIRNFNSVRGCTVLAHMMLRHSEATGTTY